MPRLLRLGATAAAAGLTLVAVRRGHRGAAVAQPRSVVRWGLKHAAAKAVFHAAARRGDAMARLVLDADLRADPHPFYDELRTVPVVAGRAAAVVAGHALVHDYLRDSDMLSGFPVNLLPAPVRALSRWAEDPLCRTPLDPPSMMVTNGAEHARYRRIALKAFTPRAIDGLRPRIEAIAAALLDDLDGAAAPTDLIAGYAEPLPILVVAEVLGVPIEMRRQFRTWAMAMVAAADIGIPYVVFREGEDANRALNSWLLGHLRHLRRKPGPDLFSRMIAAADEDSAETGLPVDELGLVVNGALLLAAGFETTVNLIGNAIEVLLRHPDQLTFLQAGPDRWPNAVEEVLRYESPIQNTFRHLDHDAVLHGTRVRRGQFLALLIAAANRDPAVFDQPHTFDVTRANAREHVSFGTGPHFCLGAALARAEAATALRLLFERFPHTTSAGPPVLRPTRIFHGYSQLPVRLHEGPDRREGRRTAERQSAP